MPAESHHVLKILKGELLSGIGRIVDVVALAGIGKKVARLEP